MKGHKANPTNMARYPIQFGKYLLLERVNVGGMAEVFKCKTFGVAGFEKLVALKRILPTMVEDEEFIRMFIDEARISVQLNHANVVQIYELGRQGDHYYIAMEYVPSPGPAHHPGQAARQWDVDAHSAGGLCGLQDL